MEDEEQEDIFPEGVELFDLDDLDTWRNRIYEDTANAVRSSFPQDYGGVRLEVDDLEYEGPDRVSLSEEKKHILANRNLVRRLRGRLKLYDNETGELLDDQRKTLMQVPVLTHSGTFIHNGTQYSPIRQSRLMPGVFVRRKANDDVEAQFNIRQGTGPGYRIGLDTRTGLYKLNMGATSIRLYSLLHDLGIPDERIREAWGDSVFEINKAKYDPESFEKAYKKFMGYRADPDLPREDRVEQLKERMSEGMVSREVLRRTMPGYLERRQRLREASE